MSCLHGDTVPCSRICEECTAPFLNPIKTISRRVYFECDLTWLGHCKGVKVLLVGCFFGFVCFWLEELLKLESGCLWQLSWLMYQQPFDPRSWDRHVQRRVAGPLLTPQNERCWLGTWLEELR